MIGVDPATGYCRNHWPMLSLPHPSPAYVALSLGAGVQSTTLALMAARGDIGPMPDFAFFADTSLEPRRVYRHLDWLETQLPFPVIRCRRDGPNIAENHSAIAEHGLRGRPTIPLYTANPTGMMPKQCSKEYKTRVVQREIRRRAGLSPRQRAPKDFVVELWIGMSKDELQRVKRSEAGYIHNRHPLVQADMTRTDCIQWLRDRQYPSTPKSSCIVCPFRDNGAWIAMGNDDPEDFADACNWDDAWRSGYPGMAGEAFVHRDRVPLRDIDLSAPPTSGDLFQEQCDACGV